MHGGWDPRDGWGTVPAVVLGALSVRYAGDLATRLSWGRLLLTAYAAGLAWMLALALVDGLDGIGVILDTQYEYLRTARAATTWARPWTIHQPDPGGPPAQWPVHIAGHPPGALMFFVVLVRFGLGSGLAAGLVVTLFAASTAVAVLAARGARRPAARPAGRPLPGDRAGRDLDVGLGGRHLRRVRCLGDVALALAPSPSLPGWVLAGCCWAIA